MLIANNIGLRYGKRVLFENVNIKFEGDNCYGVIGANGAGKSTFLKILSGEVDSTSGEVIIGKGERLSVLLQNHNAYDAYSVIDTVIMGDKELYDIKTEKDALYMKADFTNEDGIRAGILEDLFLKKNGWQAEADAAILLTGLGINSSLQNMMMSDLKESDKVKVMLARALFGEPDILLLDEPTNGLDLESKSWLEEFLLDFKNTVIVISHDRHFLNKICTHMVDIDYEKITMFAGNYDFWYESSMLIQKQMRESNKKKEEKIAELQDFIRRFSANASKSKQATSRKKSLEKIQLEEIKPSSRKYPFINFEPLKVLGKEVICISSLKMRSLSIEHDYCLSLMDARNNNYYLALYDKENKEVVNPVFSNIDEVLALIEKYNPLCIGDKEFKINDINVDKQELDIIKIVNYYKNEKSINPHLVVPEYLKLPQAMENKK